MSNRKKKILFLCTGNSCRSQMAEGWCRKYNSDIFEVYSAGIEKHGMNKYAVEVMGEEGIDLSHHYSKTLDELEVTFDIVVTVCGHAHETCPVFKGDAKVIHVPFDDPPALAKNLSSHEDILKVYRRVRDEIQTKVMGLRDLV